MILVLTLTVAVIALVMAAMAIGVAVTGRRIKGSCGGIDGDCACERAGTAPAQRNCTRTTPV